MKNPLQYLISKQLSNEINNPVQNNIVPANNSSGTSTQGSSTRDFKSTIKNRKLQQEWYYKSSEVSANQHKNWVKQSKNPHNGQNIQYEAISPNILIVEENKHVSEEQRMLLPNMFKGKQQNLHEYSLGDTDGRHNVRLLL